jgi:pimeloyl-ACP methyl ester carboxylesterase
METTMKARFDHIHRGRQSALRRRLTAGTAALACLVVAAAPATGTATAGERSRPVQAIEGRFDVGGHKLYLTCKGSGSPTVVYLHGAIFDTAYDPHAGATAVQALLSRDHRVCLYDRRNLGHSDTVDAVQTPNDAMRDMRRLLKAAGVAPPYVLLGASFGGALAHLYALTHPDEVAGMVLLDSMFPDELLLEHLFPVEQQYRGFVAEDECCTPERIAHYKVLRRSYHRVGQEPDIPVTYFASLQEPRDVNDYGVPQYDAAILALQEAYVERFSPGREVWVDAPHFMEPAIPQRIAKALRTVIAAGDR